MIVNTKYNNDDVQSVWEIVWDISNSFGKQSIELPAGPIWSPEIVDNMKRIIFKNIPYTPPKIEDLVESQTCKVTFETQ